MFDYGVFSLLCRFRCLLQRIGEVLFRYFFQIWIFGKARPVEFLAVKLRQGIRICDKPRFHANDHEMNLLRRYPGKCPGITIRQMLNSILGVLRSVR